jgi:hypothetical protein
VLAATPECLLENHDDDDDDDDDKNSREGIENCMLLKFQIS